MLRKMKVNGLSMFVVWAVLLFPSCAKESDISQSIENEDIEQVELIESVMQSESDLAADAEDGDADGKRNGRTEGCAQISIDQASGKMVVDFGTACNGPDGVVRSGKMIVRRNGKWFTPGFSRSVTFENYSVNGIKVEGTVSTSDFAANGQIIRFKRKTENGKLTFPDGKTISYSGENTYELTSGLGSLLNPSEQVFQLTGSGNGINQNGQSFSRKTVNPLIFKGSCLLTGNPYPTSGSVEIQLNGLSGLLDFGSGACDRTAVLSIGNQIRTIQLK